MPHQPTVTEIRLNNTVASFRLVTTILNELNNALGDSSILRVISNTTLSLNAKKNKIECVQLLEDTHAVLYTIINLHLQSDMPESFPPSMVDQIGKFTETTHKIHTYLEAQQDGNRIRNLFRHNELNMLLKDCHADLQHAMEVFQIKTGTRAYMNLSVMQKTADNIHEKLIEMISSLSDGTNSDGVSSMYPAINRSHRPKIFHGRESELDNIVKMLSQTIARIAILGAGGMGKTSLARVAVHHADTAAKYEHRLFVPCESATTSVEIAALIGDHIGLKPEKNLTKPVLQYFAGHSSCLLILDNMETAWEPLHSRGGVEELLSLLTDIPHLALMITMRGAERPAKVRWTQPFLPPLQPLSDDAAKEIFFDITDDIHETKELDQILCLTHNMPLAVDLIAHLVDHEGCSSVLARVG
ncbi:P-loop containing nucleoside triphosphate hydrolase protein [Mycena albidolilacea]|uniref:P-loop containing nucleoside triphosphate hydrolase protein n=1 Tax=Mycena albidolilacea TaxID=1033008 RepID=A0AAD6ZQ83_9AGAR|nr:P-loop containing nucleoside triphosphate hydrolase protein [Mycena albidolilacea]